MKRLTNAEKRGGHAPTGTLQAQWQYAYDRNGNRASESAPGGTKNYSYNNLDQMLSISGAETKTVAWDAIGRMTSDGDRAYQWSVDDRLLTVNINSPAAAVHYSYDHLGTRVGRNAPGEDDDETRYLTDLENPTGYSQALADVTADGAARTNYWYADGFGPIAQAHDPASLDFNPQYLQ